MITESFLLASGFQKMDLRSGSIFEHSVHDWIEYDLEDYTVCVSDKWLPCQYKYPEEISNLFKALTGEDLL